MTFCYDLGVELCTFDFFGWLVQAKAAGATEITFDTRGMPRRLWRRYETIIVPGPSLAGLPSREGIDGYRPPHGSSRLGSLVRFSRANRGAKFPRLGSNRPPGVARFTVTLRRQATGIYRNSNENAWRTFAGEIGARIIEDFDDEQIDLHERVAVYAGADLNLGIVCGPIMLATLTPYPVLAFGAGRNKQRIIFEKYGWPFGENAPWANERQFVLWDDDDLASIRRAFQTWKEKRYGWNQRQVAEGARSTREDGNGPSTEYRAGENRPVLG